MWQGARLHRPGSHWENFGLRSLWEKKGWVLRRTETRSDLYLHGSLWLLCWEENRGQGWKKTLKRYLLVDGSGVCGVWTWVFCEGKARLAASQNGLHKVKRCQAPANCSWMTQVRRAWVRVQCDVCENGLAPSGQCLLSALGLRQSVSCRPCDLSNMLRLTKGTAAHRGAFFLSEWVGQAHLWQISADPRSEKIWAKCHWVSAVAMGGRPQLGGSHQRNSLFFQ